MTDILNPTITLEVGGDKFVFRVPTPLERAKVGVRESAIRRGLDPTGFVGDLDFNTFFLIRGMAIMETLLTESSATWPFAGGDQKAKPVVDIEKFPPGKESTIEEVGRQFQEALDRFHGQGIGRTEPAIPEAVAGS